MAAARSMMVSILVHPIERITGGKFGASPEKAHGPGHGRLLTPHDARSLGLAQLFRVNQHYRIALLLGQLAQDPPDVGNMQRHFLIRGLQIIAEMLDRPGQPAASLRGALEIAHRIQGNAVKPARKGRAPVEAPDSPRQPRTDRLVNVFGIAAIARPGERHPEDKALILVDQSLKSLGLTGSDPVR